MLDYLDKSVLFELDVYWVTTAGANPAAIVKELGQRAPLLHIKDGPCVKGQPMTAVGDGKVDVAAVAQASAATAKWMIVELDSCATDMLAAVKKSYGYLVGKGFARGNKG
jgi:sugar phosphate isomerase/epimerase